MGFRYGRMGWSERRMRVKFISQVRNFIRKMHLSTNLWRLFAAWCARSDVPPLKLLLDVHVRWNSTQAMLVRFIKFRVALLELMTKHTQATGDCFISPNDFDHRSLSKFTEGTEILSDSNWPAAAYALPIVKLISPDLRRTNCEGSRQSR